MSVAVLIPTDEWHHGLMPFSEPCLPGCTCKKHLGTQRKERVPTTCLECGEVSMRLPCFSDRKFCNRKCANSYNSRDKRRREVKECGYSQCDTIFESLACHDKQFCSPRCLNEHKKESKRVWLVCQREECGASYWRHRQKAAVSRYCSEECKKTARQDRRRERQAQGFRRWDMSAEEYENYLVAQNHVCAICHRPESQKSSSGEVLSLSRDHCHESGKFRGLLCRHCNMALGLFGDDVESILRAAEYVMSGGVVHESATEVD